MILKVGCEEVAWPLSLDLTEHVFGCNLDVIGLDARKLCNLCCLFGKDGLQEGGSDSLARILGSSACMISKVERLAVLLPYLTHCQS